MQLNTRALLGLIPATFVLPMNTAVRTALPADGYTITMKISSGGTANVGTLKIAGDKMRLEADVGSLMGRGGGGNAGMVAGAYMLPGADGKMIIVAPNAPNMSGGTGMAISMDLAAMAARMGSTPPNVADATIEDLGAGEPILGYKTHKYRVRQGDNSTVEAWIADLPGIDFKKFATGFGARFSGMDARMAEKIPSGFALKVVMSGKDSGMIEVTKVEKTSFANADFEVPAGLQVMDLSGMMGGRGRGNR